MRLRIAVIGVVLCFLFLALGNGRASARECDLQTIQDKVDTHFSESNDYRKQSLRNIAYVRNEKNGAYYALLYDTEGTTHRERNKGFIKLTTFLCRPVMMTIQPVPGKAIKHELNKKAKTPKNIQVNDNFKKAQLHALVGMYQRSGKPPPKVKERNPK